MNQTIIFRGFVELVEPATVHLRLAQSGVVGPLALYVVHRALLPPTLTLQVGLPAMLVARIEETPAGVRTVNEVVFGSLEPAAPVSDRPVVDHTGQDPAVLLAVDSAWDRALAVIEGLPLPSGRIIRTDAPPEVACVWPDLAGQAVRLVVTASRTRLVTDTDVPVVLAAGLDEVAGWLQRAAGKAVAVGP